MAFPLLVSIALVGAQLRRGLSARPRGKISPPKIGTKKTSEGRDVVGEGKICRGGGRIKVSRRGGGKRGITKECQGDLVCTKVSTGKRRGRKWKCKQPKSTTVNPSTAPDATTTGAPPRVPSAPETTTKITSAGRDVAGENQYCGGGRMGITKACQGDLVCTNVRKDIPGGYMKCKQPKSTTVNPSTAPDTTTTGAPRPEPSAPETTTKITSEGLEVVGEDENCQGGRAGINKACQGDLVCTEVSKIPDAFWKCKHPKSTTVNPSTAPDATTTGAPRPEPSAPETTTKITSTGLAVAGPGEHCAGGITNFRKDCQEGYVCTKGRFDNIISDAFWVCKLGEPTTVAPSMTTTAPGTTEAQ